MRNMLAAVMFAELLGCGTSDHGPGTQGSGGTSQPSAGSSSSVTGGHSAGGTSGTGGHAGTPEAGSGNRAAQGSGGTSEGGKSSAGAGGDGPGGNGAGAPAVAVTARRRIVAGDGGITCALDEAQNVVCWGVDRNAWESHTALSGTYQTMALGPSATPEAVCAVDNAGTLSCADWIGGVGGNTKMMLADCLPSTPVVDVAIDSKDFGMLAYVPASGLPKSFPLTGSCTEFSAPSEAAASVRVVVAQGHACALSSAGTPTCWRPGSNPSAEPTLPGPFEDVVVSAGKACGLTADGKVQCWDDTGTEDTAKSHLAAQANDSTEQVIALASDESGASLCALFGNGRVTCSEGFNAAPSSFALPEGEALVELTLSNVHVCGVRADRTVLCVPFGCSGDCTADIAPPPGFKTTL